jgi:hypothetical protein
MSLRLDLSNECLRIGDGPNDRLALLSQLDGASAAPGGEPLAPCRGRAGG